MSLLRTLLFREDEWRALEQYATPPPAADPADAVVPAPAPAPAIPPLLPTTDYPQLLVELSRALATHPSITTPRRPLLVRWDPLFEGDPRVILASGGGRDAATARPLLHPARHSVQPRHTIIIDLRPDESELLARMKAKTRYNINLATRRGVEVRVEERGAGGGGVERWYRLYHQTCVRNRIAQRPLRYFQTLLRLGSRENSDARVELLSAYHQQTLLGGVIIAYYNGLATYLFGASSNVMRNLMANYLLQWVGMQRGREAGCTGYDLFGVSPVERGHYLSGLYRFKSGFGGRFVERWGSIDYITAPIAGRLYRSLERIYFYYHRHLKTRR